MENYFTELNNINVNGHTEQKNGLTYLSWAWAWGELKKIHPDAIYTVYENKDGLFYHTDGKTAWVKTGVTVNGIEHIEYLPVMDYRNKSIPVESINSFDVNKAIQRSLTKAVARHGLGLYIYAGEDLPEEEKEPERTPAEKAKATREENAEKKAEVEKKINAGIKHFTETPNGKQERITLDVLQKCVDLISNGKQYKAMNVLEFTKIICQKAKEYIETSKVELSFKEKDIIEALMREIASLDSSLEEANELAKVYTNLDNITY